MVSKRRRNGRAVRDRMKEGANWKRVMVGAQEAKGA